MHLSSILLLLTIIILSSNTYYVISTSPSTNATKKTTIKHLNKHIDSLNNAIGEEQEVERQNAKELCTDDLNISPHIQYMNNNTYNNDDDNDINQNQIDNNNTSLPILHGCTSNSTCALLNKNRQLEYDGMKLCAITSSSSSSLVDESNITGNHAIEISRLQEKIKAVEAQLHFGSNKRRMEREKAIQHLQNHNDALKTIDHLQAHVVEKLTNLGDENEQMSSLSSNLLEMFETSSSLQKLKATYMNSFLELKQQILITKRVTYHPHNHDIQMKKNKKRITKLKLLLSKLGIAIKHSRNIEKERQKLLENNWKDVKNELIQQKHQHTNNVDELVMKKNDLLHLHNKKEKYKLKRMKEKQEICLRNLRKLSMKMRQEALKCINDYNTYVENSKERESEMQQTNEIQSHSDQHIELSHHF